PASISRTSVRCGSTFFAAVHFGRSWHLADTKRCPLCRRYEMNSEHEAPRLVSPSAALKREEEPRQDHTCDHQGDVEHILNNQQAIQLHAIMRVQAVMRPPVEQHPSN